MTLSKFSGLRVIGRTSSFQFRDSQEDAPDHRSPSWGSRTCLRGSVQHAGESGAHHAPNWCATSEGTIDLDGSVTTGRTSDLFALQDEHGARRSPAC
jgi:hypothetical protein